LKTIASKNERVILDLKKVVGKEISKLANQIENEERLILQPKVQNKNLNDDKFINEIIYLFNSRIY
jgi:hypothetical protein